MEVKSLSTVLAMLVHDIGKIHQRTGRREAHEELSELFVRNYIPEFKYKDEVIKIVKRHHEDIGIARIADMISAAEREVYGKDGEKYESKWRRLHHVFVGERSSKMFYYRVEPLDLRKLDNLFGEEKIYSTPEEYGKLWEIFTEDVGVLRELYRNNSLDKENHMKSFIITLSELLRRYAIFVPSAPAIEARVKNSLYAHLKTSAAISLSLLKNKENGKNEEELTLIMGDVAGIQRYVYGSRTYGGALKMLRSRSIYISILTEAIAKHIINRLDLLPLNIIFCSGGQFMIISHNIEEEKLNDIYREIEEFLIKRHEGNIAIRISYVNITGEDFSDRERFSEKIKESLSKLSEAGLNLFRNTLVERFDELFGPLSIRGENVCYSCGSIKNVQEVYEDGARIPICELCGSFREVAKELALAKYLVSISWGKDVGSRVKDASIDIEGIYTGPLNFALDGLSSSFHIVKDFKKFLDFLEFLSKSGLEPLEILLMKINDTDISEELEALRDSNTGIPFPVSLGFKFITKHTPLEGNKAIKSFDKIAQESRGSKLVGYLKLDLDNIGEIRSNRCVTLSDILTFSEILSSIMEGAVDYIVSNILDNHSSEKLYLIYSGGDDLFMVGSWNTIVESLKELYGKLEGMLRIGYDAPTISAAVSLEDPKIPVKIAAETISAKLRKVKEEGKNGVIITDEKISWRGFGECLKISREIADYIENKAIPRGLIFDLSRLIADYKKDPEKTWSTYRYRLRYLLSRTISRDMMPPVESALIKSLPGVNIDKLREAIIENFRYLTDITFLSENYTRMEASKS